MDNRILMIALIHDYTIIFLNITYDLDNVLKSILGVFFFMFSAKFLICFVCNKFIC